jgi:hypothetical protein
MKDGNKKHGMHEMAHNAVMKVKKINNNPLAHGQMHIDRAMDKEAARYKSEKGANTNIKDKMDKGPKRDPYK